MILTWVLSDAVDRTWARTMIQLGHETPLHQLPAVHLTILTPTHHILVTPVQTTLQSVLSVDVSSVLWQQFSWALVKQLHTIGHTWDQSTLTIPGEAETGHHSSNIVSVQTTLPQIIQSDPEQCNKWLACLTIVRGALTCYQHNPPVSHDHSHLRWSHCLQPPPGSVLGPVTWSCSPRSWQWCPHSRWSQRCCPRWMKRS